MNRRECKKHKWHYCGNNFYSCYKCGIMRTSQQINLYEEKDQQIAELKQQLKEKNKQKETDSLNKVKLALRNKVIKMTGEHSYPQNAVLWEDIVVILNQLGDKEDDN